MPVEKTAGSRVIGGTVNATGSFLMRAERVGSETMLAQIVRMVSEAQRSRAPVQRLADRVASYFVPAVVLVAVVTFIRLGHVRPAAENGARAAERRRCADHRLPLRAWPRYADGHHGGHRTRRLAGVLVKNAEALEILEKVDTLVVDKTGTLTEGGRASVRSSRSPDAMKRPCCASPPRSSAPASIRWPPRFSPLQKNAALATSDLADFHYRTGKGITGIVDGREAALGNRALFAELKIDIAALDERAKALEADGQTVMFVAIDGAPAGLIAVADPVKASTPEAIEQLHRQRLRIVMLTGDSRATAEAVARKLGIDEVHAGVLPDQKAKS